MEIKNKAKSALTKTKNHVQKHKTGYTVTFTSIAWIGLMSVRAKQWTEFLESKSIDPDEFFCPEFYAEKLEQNS